MTTNKLTDDRLIKVLSETQATITEHNSRCVHGSVEVDALLFEGMLMEIQERRKAQDKLESFRTAFMVYSDKTDWVQGDKRFDVLIPWGKHRADVLREFIEHLESKNAALAAENSELKNSHVYEGLSPKFNEQKMAEFKRPFIEKLLHGAEYYSVCNHISAATNRAIKAVHGDYSWMPKTPVTDAYLAEVRASGVEMFAHEVGNSDKGNGLMKAIGRRALKFATQLRKGAQQ